jgi:hypothetical protein
MHGTNGFRSDHFAGPKTAGRDAAPTNGKPGCRRFSWFARIGVKRALQRHKPKGAAS